MIFTRIGFSAQSVQNIAKERAIKGVACTCNNNSE